MWDTYNNFKSMLINPEYAVDISHGVIKANELWSNLLIRNDIYTHMNIVADKFNAFKYLTWC